MVLINFSHPISESQLQQIEELVGRPIERVVEVPTQFDHERSFVEQVVVLVDKVGLSSQEWQTLPLLVNLPSLSVIAGTLLAELHGRIGYFPAIVRLKPIPDSVPPQFEVAEVINLQQVRESARQRR